ncbi:MULTISPECIES: RNA polymerase factor sigma-54 [Fusobacterium]|uniref:RNA polymerase sigma-54 factor n=1 Tax=Fusobacterium nucleatum subsp. polymorphum TaxID=76857 RepID=A0AAC9F073_FUSNP|nr:MULTISPECIES: RNA polymerase factor sigma-54 [Fusobacterium]ALM93432.1 RNA polymerase sigma-54 factor [Fusobacterium polymorphum]ALQ42538.1 RNA polymerase sigma-54 factor [Fusobacterium polymorphum]EUB34436.1 RNA polymerase sigma-54 factor [Fusobacterium sp. OBRC1]QYR60508.1 RNA polymerase factor sigma-54 [Fusobacterium polymorphum]WRL72958.1 RNA polymerase factor sigma-54 [Fusobacterium polymorphum]
MDNKLDIIEKQKLIQSLKLSQIMKLSINILKMSITELNNFIEKEISKDLSVSVELNYSNQENYDDEKEAEINYLTDEKNFFQILEEQLSYFKIETKIKKICVFIINNLNKKGYLELSKIEIKDILEVSDKELDEAFDIIHNLEPYGVGAYSLEECLKLQLKVKNLIDDKLFLFIDNYLYLLADKKYDLIKEKLNINDEQLFSYIDIIKSLNPIPSRGYSVGKIKKIIPDIFVETKKDEVFYEINRASIPQINVKDKINDKYYKKLNEIVSCIEKRFETLDKIMEIIIREQKGFFLSQGKETNTLKISDVASELNLSPSTVSRAVKEKYIKTNFGIISLRKLFYLDSTVFLYQQKILEYIENENKEQPFSDQDIVNLLEKEGIKIARRTVTKYREKLGYKSSHKRKKN